MDLCPHCGEELPPGAVACRACGSDASTGWQRDAESSSVELPEPSETPSAREQGLGPFAKIVLLVCAVGLALPLFRWLFTPKCLAQEEFLRAKETKEPERRKHDAVAACAIELLSRRIQQHMGRQ